MTQFVNYAIETLKRVFDYTPVGVSAPMPKFMDYRDAGRVLLGYEVVVNYARHAPRAYLFPSDEEKLGLVSQAKALQNARRFYARTILKIKQSKEPQMKLNWKKIFNWNIKSVSDVQTLYRENDKSRDILGYEVTVTYTYHGNRSAFFDFNSESMWTTYSSPRDAAQAYHDSMVKKMDIQRAKLASRALAQQR